MWWWWQPSKTNAKTSYVCLSSIIWICNTVESFMWVRVHCPSLVALNLSRMMYILLWHDRVLLTGSCIETTSQLEFQNADWTWRENVWLEVKDQTTPEKRFHSIFLQFILICIVYLTVLTQDTLSLSRLETSIAVHLFIHHC